MVTDMPYNDPFSRLMELITVIEHSGRGFALLSVMLAQLSDNNSVSRILFIHNKLTGQDLTAGKLKRLVNSLVEQGLVEREQEKMLGTIKVSFHRILPLGELASLYFITMFMVNDPIEELNVDLEKFQRKMKSQDSEGLIRYFLHTSIQSNRMLKKYFKACREAKNLERMKLNPLESTIGPVLGSKTGNPFKVFEELLSDYLQTSIGLTRQDLANNIEINVTQSMIKPLKSLIHTNKLGKTNYFRLDRKGIAILPILLFLIRELAVDPKLIKNHELFFCPSEVQNAWSILVRNAKIIFYQIYLG
ncbi:MAG: hypothetical protein ACXAEU_23395 [Candidatus Hodarchaeales archaeon]|jgi:predicted transcriptional regulator